MHPWHDVPVPQDIDLCCPVVVETPKGSKLKYEVDAETGFLRVEKVLHSAVHYPANCGFVPRTLAADGEPLDVLVLAQEPLKPLAIVHARTVGGFAVEDEDEDGPDHKIVAVAIDDPAFADARDMADLPHHVGLELRRFFQDYAALEGKPKDVDAFYGRDRAMERLRDALARYAAARGPAP